MSDRSVITRLPLRYVLALFVAFPAYGHGMASWIMKNPEHSHCCGEHDCGALARGDVKITPAGYYIQSRHETVPFAEARPSINEQYWICVNLKTTARRCFFAPTQGM
jgi:hypothetical protein